MPEISVETISKVLDVLEHVVDMHEWCDGGAERCHECGHNYPCEGTCEGCRTRELAIALINTPELLHAEDARPTTTSQLDWGRPDVYVVIGPSAITRAESGELLETVERHPNGTWNWNEHGICDMRGGGGLVGFSLLQVALNAAEQNAQLCGFEIERIP